MTMTSKLVAVTPARNEEKFIAKCVSSVSSQTYPVTLHLIVDDNSDDKTKEISESFGDRVVVIPSGLAKGQKVHGLRPHLVKEIGMKKLSRLVPDWKYCLIIDADVWLPSNYCKKLVGEMERNPKLAMTGAKYLETPTRLETAPRTHVRGSNHIIRRSFYDKSKIGYDSRHGEIMLERIAWIMGLETRSYPLMAFESRPTGVTLDNPILEGLYDYKLGHPILPFLLKIRRLEKRNLLQLLGWIYAKIHGEKRYFQKNEVRILYRQYLNSLFKRICSKTIGG